MQRIGPVRVGADSPAQEAKLHEAPDRDDDRAEPEHKRGHGLLGCVRDTPENGWHHIKQNNQPSALVAIVQPFDADGE